MNNTKPTEAIQRLIDGNRRFVSGVRSVEPMLSHLKMADLALNGQKPFAIILTCSDSRSPAEMIFDQGLGDLFVVRVAGNVVAPSLLASIEFAAENFGSAAVIVLGHTQCGAVTATIKHTETPNVPLPSPHLEELISRVRPAVETTVRPHQCTDREFLDRATENNVFRSCNLILEQSKLVSNRVKAGKLSVVGAILDISTGVVKFIS